MTERDAEILPFQPLGRYQWPPMPAQETLRRAIVRLTGKYARNEQPLIGRESLHQLAAKTLDRIAPPPACGPLLAELDAMIAEWLADRRPQTRIKLVVLPPGEEHGLIDVWACEHDCEVLEPPSRISLVTGTPPALPDLAGEGLLVIARLERWFLRHRNGLAWIRALLTRLERMGRPCLIGCNSWAWHFLVRTVGANLVMPGALTFQAFDERRLHRWFADISARKGSGQIAVRDPETGKDVLACGKNGKLDDDYIQSLASHSLGIPWVAWHMWRGSLRMNGAEDIGECRADIDIAANETTFWVADTAEFPLPNNDRQDALLVLHALLLHGELTAQELGQVLPLVGSSNIVLALMDGGFVGRNGDELRCMPAAYPAIRSALSSAGFSMDSL